MITTVLENLMKRVRFPQAAAHVDQMFEKAGTVFKAGLGKAREVGVQTAMDDFVEWDGATPVYEWATKSSGKFMRVADEGQSPDMVFGRTMEGKRLWQYSVDDLLRTGKFYDEHITKEFRKLERKVSKDRYQAVFAALEKPELAGELTSVEQEAVTFFKGKYEFLKTQYLRNLGGSETGYRKILNTADRWKSLAQEEKDILPQNIKEGAEFARRTIDNYVPHMFDRSEVIAHMRLQLTKFADKLKNTQVPKEVERWGAKVGEYEEKLRRLEGGDPLSWETLPSEFPFRYASRRRGAEGFSKDPFKAYKSYIYHMSKRIHTQPTVQAMATEFKNLPPEMRPYAKWYIREYAGWGQTSPLDEAAGWIATVQYWRTLGLNARSAIVNLTQQMNTWVDAGPLWSLKGYVRAFTNEGEKLFKATGIDIEVPHGFYGDMAPTAGWAERTSRILGFFFQTAERANRKHAFLTYLSKAEHKYGGITEAAVKEAIDGVHKTQFLYGKVGMPKILRTAGGRVLGQYSSFTLKQAEFMRKMWRENPAKFAAYLGMQFQGAKTVGDMMGIDLSNALGFGITAGEALDASKAGKEVEFSAGTSFQSLDWNERFFDYDNFRIVEEVPDPEPPKLPKYAGWMWSDNCSLVIQTGVGFGGYGGYGKMGFNEEDMNAFEASGAIVPPSVWMKQ